jgi:hypothetical protein
MPKASNSMEMKTTSKRPLPQAAWIFGAAFLLLLAIMHLVKPELGPTWRMISEYEIGDFGWVMRLAFFCWAAGFLCLAISLWPLLETRGGKIGKWWLVIISIALLGAGTFATQPITDLARGTVDKLHSAFGAIMIFTFRDSCLNFFKRAPQKSNWCGSRRWFGSGFSPSSARSSSTAIKQKPGPTVQKY